VEVEVKLYGAIRQHRPATAAGEPHHPFTIDLPEASTVADLVTLLGIPDNRFSAAAVNGETASADDLLQPGDTIHLFPPSAGG
jgi:molybdopterin converting factor small subunit